MAKPGWFNDNRNRAFPFLKGTVAAWNAASNTIEGLPNSVIVDAGFVAGLSAGFENGVHSIWLQQVYRVGSTFFFEFQSDAPGLFEQPIVFSRSASADEYEFEHTDNFSPAADSSETSESLSEGECDPEPLWSGYLVTGPLDDLVARLPANGSLTRTSGGIIEPALVQNAAMSYVESINLANADRTRVDAPDGCPPVEWAYDVGQDVVHVNARCLRGDVRFKAGYNATVRQETGENQIIFGAEVGAGEGQPCDEVPLFAGEVPPDGSALLEGGPRCNDIVRSINGIGGQFGSLLSGTGVRITEVPDLHKIIVDVNMSQLAICYSDSFSLLEVSETL